MTTVDLTGLEPGPAQVWGAVRLVPLLREHPVDGLRLHPDVYGDADLSIVDLPPRAGYLAFIPHAFVASWDGTGAPTASYGTQLRELRDNTKPDTLTLRFHRRMARRADRHRLRFLPLHLALEGYLALHFGGPAIAWAEWTDRAIRQGLSPRAEAAYIGADITGLDDALRIFEIHPGQCGVAVYLADALAAVFVVPHPDDYRNLHPSLLRDLYGELIHQYATMYPAVPEFRVSLDDTAVHGIDDLRAELARAHRDWQSFHGIMSAGLFTDGYTHEQVYRLGDFTLSRFLPAFDPDRDNHLGESIVDGAGNLAYLKTYRLSAAQGRRGYLLKQLAAHDWHLDAAAAALGTDRHGLATRLDRAGFGNLLRADIIDHVRAVNRRAQPPSRR